MKLFNFLSDDRPPLVDQSVTDMATMLATAGDMFSAATAELLDNESISFDIRAKDEEINALEQKVRRAVLEHMAIDPRDELTLSLLILSVVQDAERTGDLAKAIWRATQLSESPRMGPHVEALRVIRDRVQAMFPQAESAFVNADADAARVMMAEHDSLKSEFKNYLKKVASADDLTVNHAVVLAICARMIGRVSSHLSNLISSVAMPFDQIRRSPNLGDDE